MFQQEKHTLLKINTSGPAYNQDVSLVADPKWQTQSGIVQSIPLFAFLSFEKHIQLKYKCFNDHMKSSKTQTIVLIIVCLKHLKIAK